jgi:membrane-bound serine protease (ClpP class)
LSVSALVLAAVTAAQASPAAAGAGVSSTDLTVPLLTFLGVLFILLETVVPGGILGAFGALLILIAVVIATRTHGGDAGMLTLAIGLVASVAAIALGWHFLPRTKLGTKVFLDPSPGAKVSPVTTEGKARVALKLGDAGMSLSYLRPAGLAQIGEWRVDVVTRGEYVENNTPIEVVAIDGTRIVVRAKPQAAAPSG